MPYLSNSTNRKKLKLANCISVLSMSQIRLLLRMAHQKIDIIFDETILEKVMKNDEQFITSITKPTSISLGQDDEHYIVDMISMGYDQVVKIMLKLGADPTVLSNNIIKIDDNIEIQAQTNLLTIAA